jgi:hypothetical protein
LRRNSNAPGLALDVVVDGRYAYVVQGADGPAGALWGRLSVVDVSNPKTPSVVGFYKPNYIATDIVVIDSIAYLTDGRCEFGAAACWGGLHILDVSVPTSPVQIGVYNLDDIQAESPMNQSWYASSVAVMGSHAYITGGPYYDSQPEDECGLRIVDISKLSKPTVVGAIRCADIDVAWKGQSILVRDAYAYIAAGDAGWRIVSVSNWSSPAQIGYFDGLGKAWDVALGDDCAYVAADGAGLQIVDVSEPTAPSQIASVETPGRAVGVTVADSYAYVAAGEGGLRIIDVSDPANPIEVGFYDTPGWVAGAAVANDYVYVADAKTGLFVLRIILSRN